MKKLLAAALLIAGQIACAPFAAAAEEAKPAAPQQQRMRDCNAEARDMKGQPRKDFMKDCLSGKQAANKAAREERREERQEARDGRQNERQAVRAERQEERQTTRTAQQDRMKTCNADASAKALKGDARKAFMSDCLKAK